jgi:hypothetical protein
MKRFVLFLSIIAIAFSSKASDTIIVKKDTRLDILTAKQIVINKRSSMLTSTGQYKGYRIQIVSTTNREQAFKIKSDLMSKFPEEKTYVMFQSPSFKVRIGNFLKKEEAQKLRKSLNKMFPSGVFIVEDTIEYTPPF